MAVRKKEINASGTAMHLFNCFRSDALSQILNDLLALERQGIDESVCQRIRAALEVVVNEATSIPDGSFISNPLWKDLDHFKNTYATWNDVRGEDPVAVAQRREILQRLREARHKIARRTRVNQFVLSNELDLDVVGSMYGAFTQVFSAFPQMFVNLGKAIARYESKRALITPA